MDKTVKIIECPRDAWQGLPSPIAPEVKAEYLRRLIDAGFTHIDAVSFVSPAAVPQVAVGDEAAGTLTGCYVTDTVTPLVCEEQDW